MITTSKQGSLLWGEIGEAPNLHSLLSRSQRHHGEIGSASEELDRLLPSFETRERQASSIEPVSGQAVDLKRSRSNIEMGKEKNKRKRERGAIAQSEKSDSSEHKLLKSFWARLPLA